MATVSLAHNTADFFIQNLYPTYSGGTAFVRTATDFSWFGSSSTKDIDFYGAGFTYDGSNNPISGTVTAFGIDMGANAGNNFSNFELQITGLSFDFTALAPLTNGSLTTAAQQSDFIYRTVLAGNDTIDLGSTATASHFREDFNGDGIDVEAGQSLAGGNDKITGDMGTGTVSGDYNSISQGSSAIGGNDKITASGAYDGYIEGDAGGVSGFLKAGNDVLTEASGGGIEKIFGDASYIQLGGTVIAGDDVITFAVANINAANPHVGYGDVSDLFGALLGGNDKINGSLDDDTLNGDVGYAANTAYLVGGNDTIHGNGGNDVINGDWATLIVGAHATGGNDKLYGDAGSDTIYGNGGDDYIDGGTGADVMHGGAGNDTYIVDDIGDVVDETDGSGHDLVKSSVNFTLGSGMNDLTFTGTSKLIGKGDTGANVFTGNGAHDTFTGGGGNDTFVFNTKLVSSGYDTITDFGHSSDTFDIDNSVFTGLLTGTLLKSAYKEISSATSTKGVDSTDRILYDKAHGDLYFDRDGSETHYDRVKFAHVTPGTALDHTDFHVI